MTKLKVSFSLLMLGCMALILVMALPAYSQQDKKVTREEFIDLIARHNPNNPLLPKNYSTLPKPQRYGQVIENLNKKGLKPSTTNPEKVY